MLITRSIGEPDCMNTSGGKTRGRGRGRGGRGRGKRKSLDLDTSECATGQPIDGGDPRSPKKMRTTSLDHTTQSELARSGSVAAEVVPSSVATTGPTSSMLPGLLPACILQSIQQPVLPPSAGSCESTPLPVISPFAVQCPSTAESVPQETHPAPVVSNVHQPSNQVVAEEDDYDLEDEEE